MLKKFELSRPNSCLNKAAPDEPVFVLRGKDPFAAQTIRLWAAMSHGFQSNDKLNAALTCAAEMDKWQATLAKADSMVKAPDPQAEFKEAIRKYEVSRAHGPLTDMVRDTTGPYEGAVRGHAANLLNPQP